MAFKIRRKKKPPQPSVSQDPALLQSAHNTARSVLSAMALLARWQGLLSQFQTLTPDQRTAFAPLIAAELTPTLTRCIDHAAAHQLVDAEEAEQLRGGGVIVDWSRSQVEPSTSKPGGQ